MARKTWALEQIKNMRLSRHWSQEELAEQSGLSTRTIQRIEQGHKVDVGSVKLLATAFGMEVNELLGPEDSASLAGEQAKDVTRFYVALVAAIVFIGSKLTLTIMTLEDGGRPWVGFVTSTAIALMVLSFLAEKNLGPGSTKRFIKKIFGREPMTIKPLPRNVKTLITVLIPVVIALIYIFFPGLI